MIWNLNTHSEIKSLLHLSQFTTKDYHYVSTGFRLHRMSENSRSNTRMKAHFYHSNQENTLIVAQGTESIFSTVFRQHSVMEIYFWQRLEEYCVQGHGVKKLLGRNSIEKDVLTSCVNGHTFFSYFYRFTGVLDKVQALLYEIIANELNPETKERFRHIQRRLFYLICLPYKESNQKILQQNRHQ